MTDLAPKELDVRKSIGIIQSIINAIIYLKSNFYAPSQIRDDYVVYSNEKWGIRHAVCYRSEDNDSNLKHAYDS